MSYSASSPPPHSLDHSNDGLSPPSLASMQAQHHADSMVLRSLYPSSSSSTSNHAAFAPEPTVYRSVTIDSSVNHGGGGFDHSPFDPLGQFDRGYPSSGYGYGQASAKDLGLGKPVLFQQAEYKPTLKHLQQPTFLESQLVQPKLNAMVQQHSSPVPVNAVAAAAHSTTAAAVAAPVASTQSPPPAPQWLEPNSHFFCTCQPSMTAADLFDTVQATLQSLHENSESASTHTLNFIPAPERFKLDCTAYASRSGAATPFVVRIYCADASKHKYCVEFQRRRGDVTHFYELFRCARTRIQAAHPLLDEDSNGVPMLQKAASLDSLNFKSLGIALPQPVMRSWSAPALPHEAGSSGSFSKDHICETVRSLLQMCASPCIDIKLNGVLALAELSCSPSFDASMSACSFNLQETLVAEGCFQLFLDCLPIAQLDIHRASLTALANLSESKSQLCSQVLADEKSLGFVLELSASSPCCVVARECARLMANCANNLGGEKVVATLPPTHKPKFKECVQRLMNHRDAHCRKHAEDINNKCIKGAQQQPTLLNAQ